MKIRHPILLRLAGFLISVFLFILVATLDYLFFVVDEHVDPRHQRRRRFLYAFWHENILVLPHNFAGTSIHLLMSLHADGELVAQVIRTLRMGIVRGSSFRGGTKALRELLRLSRKTHLGVVPDGPRGPRRTFPIGTVFLASRTGLPIVPIAVGYDRPWRAKSWDRMAIPRPWSRVRVVGLHPIEIPANLNREELEVYRRKVEEAMNHACDLAESWAETGKKPRELCFRQATNPARKAA